MLIDTHCHLNIMIKKKPDNLITYQEVYAAETYINQANDNGVSTIINVGTSLAESRNCITLARVYPSVYAAIGIHPTDCTGDWKFDVSELNQLLISQRAEILTSKKRPAKEHIVAIGETGIDRYHPGYDSSRQKDAFKAQIELALNYDLALIVHSRDAAQETLTILDEYKHDIKRATIHCFSYDQSIANDCIKMGFMLGIGGTVTYKKNDELRAIVQTMPIENIVLETDAPFLAPQVVRGKQNEPKYIKDIAEFIAELRNTTLDKITTQTTQNARTLFNI